MQSQVPAPRPSRQVRSKASRALRRVRTRRDQSPEPRSGEEGPGSAQRRGRVLASCPALFSLPSDADSTGCSRERAPGRGGGSRGARRLCFALSVPTSSRRLGPASSWCGLLPACSRLSLSPSPFALLSSSLAVSLRRARLSALSSCKPLWTAPEYPAVPGLLPARIRLFWPPKPTSSEALGSAFAGSGLRPAKWEEKGDSGVLLSARF